MLMTLLKTTATITSAPWVWYQHPLNRSLQAKVPTRAGNPEIRDWPAYFQRTAVRWPLSSALRGFVLLPSELLQRVDCSIQYRISYARSAFCSRGVIGLT